VQYLSVVYDTVPLEMKRLHMSSGKQRSIGEKTCRKSYYIVSSAA